MNLRKRIQKLEGRIPPSSSLDSEHDPYIVDPKQVEEHMEKAREVARDMVRRGILDPSALEERPRDPDPEDRAED